MTLRFCRYSGMLACVAMLFAMTPVNGQVQTARPGVVINGDIGGFYEYLPQGYDSGNDSYPLMIFVHGSGEVGDGNANLPTVLRNGPPRVINDGQFPAAYKFIIISPQFRWWPGPDDINAVIDYAISHYRVNINKIYLTGLSMGGGVVWTYAGYTSANANRLAAIVPVCGAAGAYEVPARIIAAANLPVYAAHNVNDPTVPYVYSTEWLRMINQAPSPNPVAKLVTNPNGSSGHDAWTQTYKPSSTLFDGGNIYTWMLQYTRGSTAAIPLPVILTAYSATNTGAKVIVSWTTSFEENNDHFTIERSFDGVNFTRIGEVRAGNKPTGGSYAFEDASPASGSNYYRLSQTDIDGKVKQFDIKKVIIGSAVNKAVRLFPNPAKDRLVLEIQNDLKGKISVSILSAAGKKVKTTEITKRNNYLQETISVNELVPGYYILEIKGDNYSYSSSFIKN